MFINQDEPSGYKFWNSVFDNFDFLKCSLWALFTVRFHSEVKLVTLKAP